MNVLIENPLVSVRVLAYNHEKYIEQCLEGIVSQKTNFPFEVIIGEDCSTDGTREICRAYKAKYPNLINLIENETNLGVYQNGQKTIAAYRGKYIAWCDGDDFWTDPLKLQKQADILEKHSDISICFHKVRIIDEVAGSQEIVSNPNQKQISSIYDLAYYNYIHSPSVMFRNNLFDTKSEVLKNIPARDYAVHLLNAAKGNIYFIDEDMAVYREHKNGIWASKSLKERHNLHLRTQGALIGLFNKQIDDIILHSKAMYLYDLYKNYKHNAEQSELKNYLIEALKILVELVDKPEVEPLLNIILSDLNPMLDRHKDFEILQAIGKLAFNKKMYKDSIAFLSESLSINPNLIENRKLLAKAYYEQKDYENSKSEISKYLKSNPNDIEAISIFAKILLTYTESVGQAILVLERVVQKGIVDFDIYKSLALAYFSIENFENASKYLSKACEIYRYDATLLHLSAKLKSKVNYSSIIETVISNIEEQLESEPAEEYIEPEVVPAEEVAKPSILISIIIPLHNNSSSVKRLINSIYSTPSRYNFEVIAIDNASDDDTTLIMKEFAQSKMNFRFLRNHQNLGFAKAANMGIRNSDGEYIIILNNILEVRSNWIENLVNAFDDDESIGMTSSLLLDELGEEIYSSGVGIELKQNMLYFANNNNAVKYQEYNLLERNKTIEAAAPGSIMFERMQLPDIGVFDESYDCFLAEIDISLRTSELGKRVVCRTDSIVLKDSSKAEAQPTLDEINMFSDKHAKKFITEEEIELNPQKQRIAESLRKFKETGDVERYERLSKVLFASDYSKFDELSIFDENISDEILEMAEIVIGSDEDEAFDLSDIFDISGGESQDNENAVVEAIEEKIEEAVDEIIMAKPSSPKKILLTMYGWNESGGGTTFPKSVAMRLAKRGDEVAVFYATANHQSIKEPYYMEYKFEDGVHLYGIYNRPTIFLDANNPDREVRDENIIKHFNDVLDSFKPDVVHFNNFLGLSFAIAEIAKQRGLPTVFTPHNYHLIDPTLYMYKSDLSLWNGTDFFENSELISKNPYLENAYRRRIVAARNLLNRDIDYTLAVSNRVKDLLVDFGANSEKITVVHQVHESVENLLGKITSERGYTLPLKLGYIGGVMPHKGAHILVQAAQIIPAGKAEFYIYGFGLESYTNLLKSLDKNNSVKLMGEYQSDDLVEIAGNLDSMILPSIWEDCAPLVIVESLAMKLPVIAARIGGYPDFVKDGINGKLYAHNSPSELASIINQITANPAMLSQWRENCSLSHTFDDYIEHISKIYEKLINGEKPDVEEIELKF